MTNVSYWLAQAQHAVNRFFNRCALCSQYHNEKQAVCRACKDWFIHIDSACEQCGLPLPPSDFMKCGHCIKHPPFIDLTIAPFAYEEPLRGLLHEFKYRQGLYFISFLAQLILDHLTPAAMQQTECLIPVPIHRERRYHRGFNQAAELTRVIGKTLGLPYELRMCEKIIATPAQAKLNAAERKQNIHHAFKTRPLTHRRITIIDDLVTTGSTANELARTLKANGATHVSIWCCARAIGSGR